MLSHHIFRAYDIRGLYQKDFNEEGAKNIAKAYATYLKRKYPHREYLTVSLGRDGRNSGESLMNAFEDGLLELGISVVNIGIVTSPILYFSICANGFDGGVMITASHNPAEYNGFKLQSAGAHSICGDQIQKLWNIIQTKDFEKTEKKGIKEVKDVSEEYFSLLSEITDFEKTDWKIAIDAGNGVAGKYAPKFFREKGFNVTELYCDIDGSFPNHEADPEREENLKDLKKLVIENSLDFGIAFDGDGDRVGIVDRLGNHFSADLLLLLMVRDLLSKEENKGSSIVYDLKCSDLLKEEIEKNGGKAIMCRTGHSFVEESMQDHNAILGGEVSGHIFIADKYFGYDDALLASAKILEIAVKNKETFTETISKLPTIFTTPEEKFKIEESKKFACIDAIVDELNKMYPDALIIDGIRISLENGAWGIVRASNTSPYISARFEARTEEDLSFIKKTMIDVISKQVEKYLV